MPDPIDVVYVEVRAEGENDAARDIERAVKEIQRDVDRATRQMEKDFDRTAKEIGTSITAGAYVARHAIDDLADDATRELNRIDRGARDTGKSIAKSLGGDGGAGGGLLDSLSALGAQLRNISALAPPPILLAIAAAIPAVLALGGAVADLGALLLLLPAALGVLVSIGAALKLAFTGVGGAIAALATGDLDKIRAAMKGLAPAAREFAREINKLRKPLRDLRKDVQQSFFQQFSGDVTRLVRAALPTLTSGLTAVAKALGSFGHQLLELVGEQDILEVIGDVFESTARIITRLAPKITTLLGVLFGVAERGLPFLERAFIALGKGFDALTGFLSGSLQSGEFETFLENAFQIMSDLGGLAKAVFGLLGALFGDMGDEGSTFIQTLTEMTNALTDFFNSAEGQAILQRIVDILPIMLSLFKTGIIVLGAFALLTEATFRSLQFLGEKFMQLLGILGTFFGNFDNWTMTAIAAIGSFFTAVGSAIGGIIARVVGWVSSAASAVAAFVARIFAFITDLDRVAFAVGFITGKVIQYFIDLRNRVILMSQLFVAGVIALYIRLQQFVINTVRSIVTGVISFFNAIPGAVSAALSRMFNVISSLFSRSRSTATSATSSLVSSVVSFFRGLPGRVAAAISSLPGRILSILRSIVSGARSVGSQIINGIISGIKGGFGAAVAAAQRVASGILAGMKSALGIGSPSKLAALEVGRPIMQGVSVGAQSEASDVRSVLNGAVTGALPGVTSNTTNNGGGENLTFGTGAVQVIFQGAVPTQQEALRTGQAVGAGIAATIQQRRIRSEIRVI